MFRITPLFFFSVFATQSFAQKVYFTGFDIKANLMSDYTSEKEKATILVSAASDPNSKERAEHILSRLYAPNDKVSAGNVFIMSDLYFRPAKTSQFFRWSEWTIGFGYSPIVMNVPLYSSMQMLGDTAIYSMNRMIGKKTGYLIESKFIINSSPYESRFLKYFGLGIRAAALSETNNSVIWTESGTMNFYTKYDTSRLSNTSNALLGIYTTGGIKYNLSCKFNVFADINMGYCWRFYPEKVNTGGFNFSFSIGVKYKMGKGPPVPDESKQVPEDDEKTRKRNRKKMEVYW